MMPLGLNGGSQWTERELGLEIAAGGETSRGAIKKKGIDKMIKQLITFL